MKILIIGNGFDIAHGLPTRYSDFLEFAQRVSRIYTFKPEARLSDYDYDLKDWSAKKQIKEQLRKSFENRKTTRDNTVTVNERLDKFYYDCIKNNVWYKYILELYKHNQIHGKNWIDFESEISLVIQAIDETHTSLDQTFFELKNFLGRENRENRKDSETNIKTNENLKTKLDTFSSIYSPAFKENKGTVGDLRSRLYSDLEKLILALEIYLVDFVEPIRVDPLPVIQKIQPKPDYVISFNYTKTYERVYGIDPSNICHIHGVCRLSQALEQELADADNTSYGNGNGSNIVLGIDEYLSTPEEQKQHTDFSIFKKFVQRIRNHNDVSYVRWMEEIERLGSQPQPENVIEDDDPLLGNNKNTRKRDFNSDVFIFGHSLDVTDKDILQRFIASEFTRVHVYAHSKPAEGDLIAHLLRYVREETVIEKASMNPPMLEFKVTAAGIKSDDTKTASTTPAGDGASGA